jgi:hypothetical protein
MQENKQESKLTDQSKIIKGPLRNNDRKRIIYPKSLFTTQSSQYQSTGN